MNNKTTIPQAKLTPICLSLRNNAACCIRLRPLRDLRENNTQAYTINIAQTKPQCLSQIIADTPQNFNNLTSPSLTVFVCAIMQLAAFLCVISAICGRITRKSTQSIHTEETPMSLADPADIPNIRQRNLQRDDAACCIP